MQFSFLASYRCSLSLSLVLLVPMAVRAEGVPTRRKQEPMHQEYVVKSLDGKLLAKGEEVTTAEGDQVRSDLTFRFLDGSLDEQITTFTQGKVFHLIHDWHVQKGPSFPTPLDMTVDVPSRTVSWHQQKKGADTVSTVHMALPDDLGNGLVPLLVEKIPPGAAGVRVSWVAVAIRPLVVTVAIHPDTTRVDGLSPLAHAHQYLLHVELHGLAFLVAPLIDKQPADLHFWVTDGAQPSFLRLAGPFYQGAPVWVVESVGPEIPSGAR
ncbi:MAG: hypothetical protein ACLGXA_16325 [Acidobacteriota bacterium]